MLNFQGQLYQFVENVMRTGAGSSNELFQTCYKRVDFTHDLRSIGAVS